MTTASASASAAAAASNAVSAVRVLKWIVAGVKGDWKERSSCRTMDLDALDNLAWASFVESGLARKTETGSGLQLLFKSN